jgi:hypothetical protein
MGVELLAPYSSKTRDPTPKKSAFLSRLRYRIDSIFSQLTERYSIKRVWARDMWQLCQVGCSAQSALSHRGILAQRSDGQPTSATGEAPSLKPAHRVS